MEKWNAETEWENGKKRRLKGMQVERIWKEEERNHRWWEGWKRRDKFEKGNDRKMKRKTEEERKWKDEMEKQNELVYF